jgi:hypothetical protein
MVEGTVEAWSDDEGWGVLESAEVPEGCGRTTPRSR